MLYYKVKPGSDQIAAPIIRKDTRLIKNQLYTDKEISRAIALHCISRVFVQLHFDLVDLPPHSTYKVRGIRFESTEVPPPDVLTFINS